MAEGLPNVPRVMRGAFVELGLSLPPLIVVFQFNPVQVTRRRSLAFAAPGATASAGTQGIPAGQLRRMHGAVSDLREVQEQQVVSVDEQRIGFDLRLDATDGLDEADPVAEQLGIAPQLSTLELMVHPKEESLLGAGLGALLGPPSGFSFTRGENPPLILFVFGRKRVLPVNITTMNITETEFSTDLNPVRATVAVELTVIEGPNVPYRYSKAMTEAMSVVNAAGADLTSVVLPG